MSTVIDRLVVELGMDTEEFAKKSADVRKALILQMRERIQLEKEARQRTKVLEEQKARDAASAAAKTTKATKNQLAQDKRDQDKADAEKAKKVRVGAALANIMAAQNLAAYNRTIRADDAQKKRDKDANKALEKKNAAIDVANKKRGKDHEDAEVRKKDKARFLQREREKKKQLKEEERQNNQSTIGRKKLFSEIENSFRQFRNAATSIFSAIGSAASSVSREMGFLKSSITSALSKGLDVSNFSKNMGESSQDMVAWGNAVEGLGGSAEAFRATIEGISNAQARGALYGENPLVRFATSLGVDLADSANKAIPPLQFLLKTSDALVERIARTSRPRVKTLAEDMGIDAGTFNLLAQGSKEIIRLVEEQKKLNVISDQSRDALAGLEKKVISLKQSFEGFFDQMIVGAAPSIEKLLSSVNKLFEYIKENKEITLSFLKSLAAGFIGLSIVVAPLNLVRLAVVGLAGAYAILTDNYKKWSETNKNGLVDWKNLKGLIKETAGEIDNLIGYVSGLRDRFKSLFDKISESDFVKDMVFRVSNIIEVMKGVNPIGGEVHASSSRTNTDPAPLKGKIGDVHRSFLSRARDQMSDFVERVDPSNQEYRRFPSKDAGYLFDKSKDMPRKEMSLKGNPLEEKGSNSDASNYIREILKKIREARYRGKQISMVDLIKDDSRLTEDQKRELLKRVDEKSSGASSFSLSNDPKDSNMLRSILRSAASFMYPNRRDIDQIVEKEMAKRNLINNAARFQRDLNVIRSRPQKTPEKKTPVVHGSLSPIQIGKIEIHTLATNAQGIAKDIVNSLNYQLAAQANTGFG